MCGLEGMVPVDWWRSLRFLVVIMGIEIIQNLIQNVIVLSRKEEEA